MRGLVHPDSDDAYVLAAMGVGLPPAVMAGNDATPTSSYRPPPPHIYPHLLISTLTTTVRRLPVFPLISISLISTPTYLHLITIPSYLPPLIFLSYLTPLIPPLSGGSTPTLTPILTPAVDETLP